jgi:hypothetical protein
VISTVFNVYIPLDISKKILICLFSEIPGEGYSKGDPFHAEKGRAATPNAEKDAV